MDSVRSQSSVWVSPWPLASSKARWSGSPAQLLDDLALGLDEQRGLGRQARHGAAQRADDEAEDQQQQHQVQDAAQPVQAAPHTPEETAYCTHAGAAAAS